MQSDRWVIGIDPGNTGAIAFYNGKKLEVFDMPTLAIQRGKSVKNKIDAYQVAGIIRSFECAPDEACLEQVGAMPKQGVSSMFTFGRGVGVLEGVLAGLEISVSTVTPQKWQKEMGVAKGKDAARARAIALFPKYATLFARKRDDGRADAALMARYWFRRGK